MATRYHSRQLDVSFAVCATWALLAADDVGDNLDGSSYADRSVQIDGTFGGASVEIQGSNDGTNWYVLTDPQGNLITKTSASLEQISEITRFVRPLIDGGDGTTDITVTLFARRAR